MAIEQSRFFDYTEDKPAEYQADEFAEFFRTFLSDGVPVLGTNLQITANDGGMFVNADYGAAMIQGYGYWLKDDDADIMQLPITAADTDNSRIDRVVLRRDKTVSVASISMVVLTGTPSATPAPPELTRAGNIYEISLAQVRVDKGVLSIAANKVTDERADQNVCGYVENLSVREQIAALYTALAGKAAVAHTQTIETITGLVNTLEGKALKDHDHAQSNVTGLIDALAGKLSSANGTVTLSKLNSEVLQAIPRLIGGTAITNGQDLNQLTTPGMYECAQNETTVTLSHCPVTTGFRMTVTKYPSDVNTIHQRITDYFYGNVYERITINASAGWMPWKQAGKNLVLTGTSASPPSGSFPAGTIYIQYQP